MGLRRLLVCLRACVLVYLCACKVSFRKDLPRTVVECSTDEPLECVVGNCRQTRRFLLSPSLTQYVDKDLHSRTIAALGEDVVRYADVRSPHSISCQNSLRFVHEFSKSFHRGLTWFVLYCAFPQKFEARSAGVWCYSLPSRFGT